MDPNFKLWLTSKRKHNIDNILGIVKDFDTKNNTNLLNKEFITAFTIFLYHNQ